MMEAVPRVLDQMKLYLTSLNYPNIEICSEDDVVQIFAPQNRIKLLMWSLSQLSDAVAVPLEEEAQLSYMADIIYQWGFCKLNEKIGFVKCELDMGEQFVIFSRLFLMLINKESTTALKEVDFEDLKKMVEYSNNLKNRVQKSISLESHADHKRDIMNELDLMQKDLNSLDKLGEFRIPILKDINVEGFEDDLVTFATNSKIISSCTPDISPEPDKTLQLQNIESLDVAVSKLQNTIKHVQNIKAASNHKEMAFLKKSTPEISDKWCDRNLEKLERMLQKCQPREMFLN